MDVQDDIDLKLKAKRKSKRPRSRPLAYWEERTYWLTGDPLWRDGAIWLTDEGVDVPLIPATLDKAARCLKQWGAQLQEQRERTDSSHADSGQILEKRLEAFALARLLAPIRAPDLELLCAPSRARNPQAAVRLVDLLLAESLCQYELPVSPAKALLARPELARPHLVDRLSQPAWPLKALALVALVLGCVAETGYRSSGELDPWLARCFLYGSRHGMPRNVEIVVGALRREDVEVVWELSLLDLEAGEFNLPLDEIDSWVSSRGASAALQRVRAVQAMQMLLPAWTGGAQPRLTRNGRDAGTFAEVWSGVRGRLKAAIEPVLPRMLTCGGLAALGELDALNQALLQFPLQRALQTPSLPHYRKPQTLSRRTRQQLAEVEGKLTEIYRLLARVNNPELVVPSLLLAISRQPAVATAPVRSGYMTPARWVDEWATATQEVLAGMKAVLHLGKKGGWYDVLELLRLGYEPGGWVASLQPRCIGLVLEVRDWLSESETEFLLSNWFHRYGMEPDREVVLRVLRWMRPLVEGAAPRQRGPLLQTLSTLSVLPYVESESELETLLPAVEQLLPSFPGDTEYRLDRLVHFLRDQYRLGRSGHWSTGALAALQQYWLQETLSRLNSEVSPDLFYPWYLVSQASQVVAGEDISLFGQLLCSLERSEKLFPRYAVEPESVGALRPFSGAYRVVAEGLQWCPKQTLELLQRCQYLGNLPLASRGPLARMEGPPALVPAPHWRPVLALNPLLLDEVRRYVWAQRLQQLPESPPSGLLRILKTPHKLRQEGQALEQRLAGPLTNPGQRAHLEARLNSLREQMGSASRLRARVAAEASEWLAGAVRRAEFAALEKLVEECLALRLKALGAPLPQDGELGLNEQNAALFSVSTQENRKWARSLLRAHYAGEKGWREQIPANAVFLEKLRANGVDTDIWLSRFELQFHFLRGFSPLLWAETDPMHILQMGNYFDTCLSMDGINANSAVANAVELNKRVIFASRDGRIVGRQLVAIDDAGKLVGFHVYNNVEPQHTADVLGAFLQFNRTFAEVCGLVLADDGEVSPLFVRDWYNDGVVAWTDLEKWSRPRKKSRRRVRSH